MTADDRLDGAFKRVAAAWRGTSQIGQQSFDDVLFHHPDLTDVDLADSWWTVHPDGSTRDQR